MIYPGCYPEAEQDTMEHIRGVADELYGEKELELKIAEGLIHIMAISNDSNLRLRLAIFAERISTLKEE